MVLRRGYRRALRRNLAFETPKEQVHTSWFRTETPMLTNVSPLLNFRSSAGAGTAPRRSQMESVKAGWDVPEKICTPRMVGFGGES
ncbi:hypothetical protein TMatcc_001382 [Talaromyces marneffei ATCC 18224]